MNRLKSWVPHHCPPPLRTGWGDCHTLCDPPAPSTRKRRSGHSVCVILSGMRFRISGTERSRRTPIQGRSSRATLALREQPQQSFHYRGPRLLCRSAARNDLVARDDNSERADRRQGYGAGGALLRTPLLLPRQEAAVLYNLACGGFSRAPWFVGSARMGASLCRPRGTRFPSLCTSAAEAVGLLILSRWAGLAWWLRCLTRGLMRGRRSVAPTELAGCLRRRLRDHRRGVASRRKCPS